MEAVTVAKVAGAAVKNKDKLGKVIGIIAAIVFAPIFLVVTLFLSVMSAFMPDGVLQSPEYFAGEDSAIYSAIQEVTVPYYDAVKAEMAERRENVISNNTYEYEIIDENGITQTVTDIPSVTRKINYVPESLIIAYLIMTDGIDVQSAVIDANKVEDFLNAVCYIEESDQGNNIFLIENKVKSEEEIANLYFTSESDKNLFIAMSSAYGEYFTVAETTVITDDGNEATSTIYPANISSVPLYLQYDFQWGNIAYGNGTIRHNGCCPTCLAMVFSYLCQQNIYPSDVVVWSGNTYYVNGSGTAWTIFNPAAAHWGVNCTNIGKDKDAMLEALSSGKLIIASMGPGTFTQRGHFIVLTGITESGGITVNDPNDNTNKQHGQQEFEPSLILRECKNMWVFER